MLERNDEGEWKRTAADFSRKDSYKMAYKIIMYYMVSYVIPLILLLFTTSRLIHAVNMTRKRRSQMTKKTNNITQQREDVTITLIVLVTAFCVCQLPAPIRVSSLRSFQWTSRVVVTSTFISEITTAFQSASTQPSISSSIIYLIHDSVRIC